MKRAKHTTPKTTILACDPSFTWGYAVIRDNNIISTGCIKTIPENKKRRIRKGDDNVRRVDEHINKLLNVVEEYNVDFIVSELPHGSQSASGALMIGVVITVIEAISICYDIPVEWYSENDAKKALLGRISASKAEVIQTIEEELDVKIKGYKYVREAIADALAIYYVATIQSPTLKILMR